MNQILDFGAGGGNDNNNNRKEKKTAKKEKKVEYNNYNNYNNYNTNDNGGFGGNNFGGKEKQKTPMSDKVVKVFAFIMIILAIAFIASGAMTILKNKKDETETKNQSVTEQQVEANISAELDEISGEVTITVESPVVISKMIYSWDREHDNVVSGEKQTSLEEVIIAPSGEHVLHVSVIDTQDHKTTKDFTFDSATGIDTTQPEITLTVTEEKKLLVTATDDTSIDYVTYTWDDGETVTMEADEGQQEFEFEIEIPRGKHTIVVIAVDGSDSANAKSTTKVLEGVTKPEINYGFLDATGAVLQITCTHENGIKSIYYTLNGNPYQWQVGEGEEAPKELSFTQESVQGRNEMTITVTSVDDTEAVFNPVWDYGTTSEEQTTEEQTQGNQANETNNTTVEGDSEANTNN